MKIQYINPADASRENSTSTSLAYFRRRVTVLTPNVHLVREVTDIAMQEPTSSVWIEYLDPEIESMRDMVHKALKVKPATPLLQHDQDDLENDL